jgi:hypothetical protein
MPSSLEALCGIDKIADILKSKFGFWPYRLSTSCIMKAYGRIESISAPV